MYKKLGKKKMLEILKSKIEISDRKYTEYMSCKSMESLFKEASDGQTVHFVHMEIANGRQFFYIEKKGKTMVKWEE